MKKNELAKKSRKLFSAILAGAMLTTSVIPESFVWAAEAEDVQGFGDSESMGFESTPDPVTGDGEDGENQEVSDFQGVADIQNGNAIVNMEEGFTDEIASFSSNGSDIPVESGFQSPGICRRTAGANQHPSNCGRISKFGGWYYSRRKHLKSGTNRCVCRSPGYCRETGSAFRRRAGTGGCK